MSAQPDLLAPTDAPAARREILAISLWQPWASLMALGFKPDETRHWQTGRRGLTAIHAAKKIDRAGAPQDLCRFAFGRRDWWVGMPVGAYISVGELWDCERAEAVGERVSLANYQAGDFGPGRFAHRYRRMRPLLAPIPARGFQGFWYWTPPADLEALLGPVVDPDAMAAAFERGRP